MRNKLLPAAMVILLVLSLTPLPERAGEGYLDQGLKSATVIYAMARVLNGVISVIQEIEVAATPAGIGLSAEPGQILDPLNDLIEQFSSVMLLATVSLAVQKLLLTFSGWWGARIITSAVLLLLVVMFVLERPGGIRTAWRSPLYKIVLLVLFVRFVIPFVAVSSGLIEALFLNAPIQERTEKLQLVEKSVGGAIAVQENQDWYESLLNSSRNLLKVKENAALLKEKISQSISTIIDLIALFIIQTILLPLAFLYLAVWAIKRLAGYDFANGRSSAAPIGTVY